VAFRDLYGAVVLAVSRTGQKLHAPLIDVDFRPGDALFLEAPRAFVEQRKNSGDFALISRLDGEGPATSAQAPVALLILISMVLAVSTGLTSMLEAAAVAAALMLITRCCSEETARQSIDWPLLLTIGAAFGFGRALETTGIATGVADNLLRFAGGDPWVSLVIVFVTTAILTEFVTNNAAAVIVLPIALATASQLGVNYVPFVITVMIAASASFVTPIGYQTNLMVYTAGGYRFGDFARMGLPMTLLVGSITCTLAPLVYGF
jgi:di/tricarboxylate transporter